MNLSQRYIILLLAALVLGVYYPVLFTPLCLTDDYLLFFSWVDAKFSWKSIFVVGEVSYYRPLVELSLWVDQILWMFEESFMHLDNILIHLSNVILVYFVAMRAQLLVFDKKNCMAACGAAAVFAMHPLCSESINWIPARVDPMAAFFVYLALLFFLTALYKQSKFFYILSFLSLFIAPLAKESAVFIFPSFIFMSFAYWRERNYACLTSSITEGISFTSLMHSAGQRLVLIYQWLKISLFQVALFSSLPLLYFVMRRLSSTKVDRGTAVTYLRIAKKIDISVWDPIFLSLKGLGFYLKKIFIPWPLNFNIVYVSDWYILLGLAFFLLALYLLWRSSVVTSFFVISIMPIPPALVALIASLAWTPYAERYLYISIAPVVIGLMLMLQRSERLERYKVLLPVSIIAVFALTTVNRNILWTDSLAFYKNCLVQAPGFRSTANNYAAALAREGLTKEADEFRRKNVPPKVNTEFFSDTKSSTSSTSVR